MALSCIVLSFSMSQILALPSTAGVVDIGETVNLTYWLSTENYHDEGGTPVEGNCPNTLEQQVGVGIFIAAFDEAVLGMEERSSKKFVVTGEKHDYSGELAGKDLYYEVKINFILDDDMANTTTTEFTAMQISVIPSAFSWFALYFFSIWGTSGLGILVMLLYMLYSF